MDILRVLLFPFAVLYDLITRLRNHLYNIGQKRSFRFETMVISVGNLRVGGSGKTPTVEYLIRLLTPEYQLATLSRGYGRRTRGIRFAGPDDNAQTIGDEPFQLYRNTGDYVKVVVGEERAVAIPEILHAFPETNVIVLDDAYQHRSVTPQLSILLTGFQSPFYKDFLLPAGRLREARSGARRADAIVVTKCPSTLEKKDFQTIESEIQKYAGDKPVFFSALSYDAPVSFGSPATFTRGVILVSGIADASLFEDYARTQFEVLHHFKFEDHHLYTKNDLADFKTILGKQSQDAVFLTTEKDMVKLISLIADENNDAMPWFYLPMKITFLKNGPEFDKLVLHSIENSKKIN